MQATVNKINCEQLADIIRKAGYRVTIEKWASGNKYLHFGCNGSSCYAYLYDETNVSSGEFLDVKFSVGLKYANPPSLEVANAWNSSRTFGRSHISKTGSIFFEHIFSLRGGVTTDNILQQVKIFDINFGAFLVHLQQMTKRPEEPAEPPQMEIPPYDKSRLN